MKSDLELENKRLRDENERLKAGMPEFEKAFAMIEERFKPVAKKPIKKAASILIALIAALALFGIVGSIDYQIEQRAKSTIKTK